MKKGISPIVAVVLLIAIAVVAAVGLYFWIGGLATKQPHTPTSIAISGNPIGDGKLLIANLGSVAFNASELYAIESEISCEGTGLVLPSQQILCTVTGSGDVTIYGNNTGAITVYIDEPDRPACSPNCSYGDNCTDWQDCTSFFCNVSSICSNCTSNVNCSSGMNCTLGTCISCAPNCTDGVNCDSNGQCESGNCTNNTCGDGSGTVVTFQLQVTPFTGNWTNPWAGTLNNVSYGSIKLAIDVNSSWSGLSGSATDTITPPTKWAEDARIAVDALNIPHIAFRSNYAGFGGGCCALGYRHWNGTGWSGQVNQTDWLGAEGNQAGVAIDSNNNPHVVWATGDLFDPAQLRHIHYRYWNGTHWWGQVNQTDNVSIATNMGSDAYPRIFVDSADTPHIIWLDGSDVYGAGTDKDIFYRNWNGTHWSGYVNRSDVVSGDSSLGSWIHDIDTDTNNRPHVAWRDSSDIFGAGINDTDVFYRRWTGAAWSGNINSTDVISSGENLVNGEQMNSEGPSIDVDSNNQAHVAWNSWLYPEYKIFYTKWNGVSWDIEHISTESSPSGIGIGFPHVDVDSNDDPHITWYDDTYLNGSGYDEVGSDQDVFYKRKTSNGWSKVEVVSNETLAEWDDAYWPIIELDQNNDVHIVWSSNMQEVYYKKATQDGSPQYFASGTFLSDTLDTSITPANFTSVTWGSAEPAFTTFGVTLFFSNNSNMNPNISASVNTGDTNVGVSRYAKYEANFTTTDQSVTSTLNSFELNYSTFAGVQSLNYTVEVTGGVNWVSANISSGYFLNETDLGCAEPYSNIAPYNATWTYNITAGGCNSQTYTEEYP